MHRYIIIVTTTLGEDFPRRRPTDAVDASLLHPSPLFFRLMMAVERLDDWSCSSAGRLHSWCTEIREWGDD
jgi:hypothetical protein